MMPAPAPFAVSGPRATILLEAGALPALVEDLQAAVGTLDPVHPVFEALSRAGVKVLPSFVCAIRETDAVRLLARGAGVAGVHVVDGDEREISGSGVATWTEVLVRHPRLVSLSLSASPGFRLILVFGLPDTVSEGEATPDPASSTLHSPAPPGSNASLSSNSTLSSFTLSPDSLPALLPSEESPVAANVADEEGRALDFRHLVDETIFSGVEEAVVRDSPERRDPSGAASTSQEDPAPITAHRAPEPEISAPSVQPLSAVTSSQAMPSVPASGLIDRVPGSEPDPIASPRPTAGEANALGDHDGRTIAAADLRRAMAAAAAAAGERAAKSQPIVQTVRCPAGHLNPPRADRCRCCTEVIVDRTIRSERRPVLGTIKFNDGSVVELDRPLLIGRKPTLDARLAGSDQEPRLITLRDTDKVLSRVHAEVRLDDWQVLVVDHGSVNSTFVRLPGKAPVRLLPHDPYMITVGAEVNLGDVASFVYEALP